MKMSVSLPDEDVAFIDEHAARTDAPGRSAVLHEAIRLLRDRELEDQYERAWDEWSTDADGWNATSADGLDAAR
ncbi:ribbon-helix-helix domain-containing protein [Actinocatenispora sera]|jgi:Arc/MetJ-type ribon-helix-helix transcriptional regulator|nr:ribbon-helix-helix domain-containing protein [Actinocatenispora sera]